MRSSHSFPFSVHDFGSLPSTRGTILRSDNGRASDHVDGYPPQRKKRVENVDLFAAGDRAVIDLATKPLETKPAAPTVAAPSVLTAPSPAAVTVPASSMETRIDDLLRNASAAMGPALRSNTQELHQAEVMRLEAEREMLLLDQQRLIERKRHLASLDKLVLQLWEGNLTPAQFLSQHKDSVQKDLLLRLVELANASPLEADRQRLLGFYDALLDGLLKIDDVQHAAVLAAIQMEVRQALSPPAAASSTNAVTTPTDDYSRLLEGWLKQVGNATSEWSEGGENATAAETFSSLPATRTVRFPSSLPLSMVPLLLQGEDFSNQDLQFIRNDLVEGLFHRGGDSSSSSGNTLEVQESAYIVTIRGLPRRLPLASSTGTSTASVEEQEEAVREVFQEMQRRLNRMPGIGQRARLFLLPDYDGPLPPFLLPSPLSGKDINDNIENDIGTKGYNEMLAAYEKEKNKSKAMKEKYSGRPFDPIFVLLSNEALPRNNNWVVGITAVGSLIATVISILLFATDVNSLNLSFLQQVVAGQDSVLVARLAYILFACMGLQAVHDGAHYLTAKLRGVRLSFPSFLLPSLQLGLFGSITPLASYPKDRRALFDVALAGPMAGFLVSLALTGLGVYLTGHASVEEAATFPALPVPFVDTSFLLHNLVAGLPTITPPSLPPLPTASDSTVAAANALASTVRVLPVHPLFVAGAVGLFSNALNSLPIGRLDGGRVSSAIAGRRAASSISVAFLFMQAVSFFTSSNPITLFWAITVILLQRAVDLPPEDDVTPLVTAREEGAAGKTAGYWIRMVSIIFCSLMTLAVLWPAPASMLSASLPSPEAVQGSLQSLFSNPAPPSL